VDEWLETELGRLAEQAEELGGAWAREVALREELKDVQQEIAMLKAAQRATCEGIQKNRGAKGRDNGQKTPLVTPHTVGASAARAIAEFVPFDWSPESVVGLDKHELARIARAPPAGPKEALEQDGFRPSLEEQEIRRRAAQAELEKRRREEGMARRREIAAERQAERDAHRLDAGGPAAQDGTE
jgi:hypothetical protein